MAYTPQGPPHRSWVATTPEGTTPDHPAPGRASLCVLNFAVKKRVCGECRLLTGGCACATPTLDGDRQMGRKNPGLLCYLLFYPACHDAESRALPRPASVRPDRATLVVPASPQSPGGRELFQACPRPRCGVGKFFLTGRVPPNEMTHGHVCLSYLPLQIEKLSLRVRAGKPNTTRSLSRHPGTLRVKNPGAASGIPSATWRHGISSFCPFITAGRDALGGVSPPSPFASPHLPAHSGRIG